jgi:hypothetical protein
MKLRVFDAFQKSTTTKLNIVAHSFKYGEGEGVFRNAS